MTVSEALRKIAFSEPSWLAARLLANEMRPLAEAHEREIARLREALETYGEHSDACLDQPRNGWKCSCGFSTALHPTPEPGAQAK